MQSTVKSGVLAGLETSTAQAPYAMILSMSPAEIEQSLREHFAADPHGAAAVYLFGSVARGTSRDDSDVDVAVLYAADPPATLDHPRFALEAELEARLGRPVQVAVLNGASPDFVHRVLRDGKLVLNQDPARRIQFEVKSRNEYFDIEPHLLLYRRTANRP